MDPASPQGPGDPLVGVPDITYTRRCKHRRAGLYAVLQWLVIALLLPCQIVLAASAGQAHLNQNAQLLHTRRLHVPITENHTWPGFIIPARERNMGLVYRGDWERLRRALWRYRQTGELKIGVIGGSITAGAGAIDSHSWVEWFEDWLGVQYNGTHDGHPGRYIPPEGDPRVSVANGAVPGTSSSYMAVCYNKHVPKDVDIVILEYALNDDMLFNPIPFNNAVRRPFERLLRKLLTYPKFPAVVLLNAFRYHQLQEIFTDRFSGQYYAGADAEFFELATYYQIPMLSIKGCCYGLMKQGAPGFRIDQYRGDKGGRLQDIEIDDPIKDEVFYWDNVHPNGRTGHRAMADLVIDLFQHVERSLKQHPWTTLHSLRLEARHRLPEPMIPGNWESQVDKCFVGEDLQSLLLPLPTEPLQANGQPPQPFEWMNDQPPDRRAKWGYIGTRANQMLRFALDTRAAANGGVLGKQTAGSASQNSTTKVSVLIARLMSYEGMGLSLVRCVSGCECGEMTMDSLHQDRVSLVKMFEVKVTQHERCVMDVIALGHNTHNNGNGTKVKITGVMLSDEGAELHPSVPTDITGFNALDPVMDTLSEHGVFDVKKSGWATAGMEQVERQRQRAEEQRKQREQQGQGQEQGPGQEGVVGLATQRLRMRRHSE